MILSPARQTAVEGALAQVRQRTNRALQASDLEAAKQALVSLSLAVSFAIHTIHNAEQETRAEAADARLRKALEKVA